MRNGESLLLSPLLSLSLERKEERERERERDGERKRSSSQRGESIADSCSRSRRRSLPRSRPSPPSLSSPLPSPPRPPSPPNRTTHQRAKRPRDRLHGRHLLLATHRAPLPLHALAPGRGHRSARRQRRRLSPPLQGAHLPPPARLLRGERHPARPRRVLGQLPGPVRHRPQRQPQRQAPRLVALGRRRRGLLPVPGVPPGPQPRRGRPRRQRRQRRRRRRRRRRGP